MTRAELETLSVGEQSKWLRDAGWEVDNLGRSLVWKLKSKSGTTTATFPAACEMQLRRDTQKRSHQKKIDEDMQRRLNEEYIKGIEVGFRATTECADISFREKDSAFIFEWSEARSKIDELIVQVKNRKSGEDL